MKPDLFLAISGKVPASQPLQPDVWPAFGDECEMNWFYRQFDSAEGWLGKSFLAIWKREHIRELAPIIARAFPPAFHFFASDGGGSQFGFHGSDSGVRYLSAPEIGDESDVTCLGAWSSFLRCIESVDYI